MKNINNFQALQKNELSKLKVVVIIISFGLGLVTHMRIGVFHQGERLIYVSAKTL
ncbi:hypothetical protein [Lactiplantibacillus plantarum]|uniref:hypothetical protein n=1 Tax=Lactiplantibacillus plantarum TaxID=1590 RepID=UPI0022B9817E|nr:hypothetical protein [Lactiplantibacillus plantarum]WBF40509.1 hypothetical protein MUB33_01655 [Lactiplantibacillus plantarum]